MPESAFRSAKKAISAVDESKELVLLQGECSTLLRGLADESIDLVVSSPPYCIGKAYEQESTTTTDFIKTQKQILPEIVRLTKLGGSICWQTGYHVTDGTAFPLDYAIFQIMQSLPDVHLRNRIIWSFGHGLNSTNRFSGRHEVVLWFTKGTAHKFDLDAVRVPQKYPGKRYYKGESKGELSGNPLGKNPGDVWEMPNVNANHIEKTEHPCQFPVALAQRLIRALCPLNGTVLDPFLGSGSTAVAAVLDGRKFIGSEIRSDYMGIALKRISAAKEGTIRVRDIDKPIYVPDPSSAVATRPDHFRPENADGPQKTKCCA